MQNLISFGILLVLFCVRFDLDIFLLSLSCLFRQTIFLILAIRIDKCKYM